MKISMQSKWDSLTSNKLKTIKPNIGQTYLQSNLKRANETRIHRLRIGHIYITHTYLLTGENQPLCIPCQTHLSVKHILIECPFLACSREKHFVTTSMKDLFENIPNIKILDFLKELQLYAQI